MPPGFFLSPAGIFLWGKFVLRFSQIKEIYKYLCPNYHVVAGRRGSAYPWCVNIVISCELTTNKSEHDRDYRCVNTWFLPLVAALLLGFLHVQGA